jgi:Tfp pilus assembly protein PilN
VKRVRIDFAEPSVRRTLFHTPRHAWSLAWAALCVCGPLASQADRYFEERRAYEAQLAARDARTAAPLAAHVAHVALRQPAATEAQAAAVNAAILQLNLPWRALHDAVKAATPPSVALLGLEPDAKRRMLRITAEARGSDEMLAYVERMHGQDWFAGVVLTRHEINEQDPNRPLRFQIDAQWRPQ